MARFRFALIPICIAHVALVGPAGAEDFSLGVGAFVAPSRVNLSELNEALRASGYEPIGETVAVYGMGIRGSAERIGFGLDVGLGLSDRMRHTETGWDEGVYHLSTFLDSGYDVYRAKGWTLAAHGGIGFWVFSMDIDKSRQPFPLHASNSNSQDSMLSKSAGLVRAAFGVSHMLAWGTPSRPNDRMLLQGGGLLLDLRAGYRQQFASTGWEYSANTSQASGPSVDFGGPFVMFTLGFAGGSVDFGAAKHACGAPPAHGSWKARGLTCVADCEEGFGDCDDDPRNGCEVSFAFHSLHCGGCGKACNLYQANSECRDGACVVTSCKPGFSDCNGIHSDGCETDTNSSQWNCGACQRMCPNSHPCERGDCKEPQPLEVRE